MKKDIIKGIGKLHKGDLYICGYSNVISMKITQRREALKRCVVLYGALTLFHKLNAIYVYNKNKNPKLATIFKNDRDWVKKHLFI